MTELDKFWNAALPEELPIDEIAKEQIIIALATAVADWLQRAPEELMSKLYRLDVREHHLQLALKSTDPAFEIAERIYERQCQKIVARAAHKSNKNVDEDLAW